MRVCVRVGVRVGGRVGGEMGISKGGRGCGPEVVVVPEVVVPDVVLPVPTPPPPPPEGAPTLTEVLDTEVDLIMKHKASRARKNMR